MTNYIDILQQIDETTTIITPNRRLAATLHKLYKQHLQQQGKNCWLTPTILPLQSWIKTLWDHLTLHDTHTLPFLLNSTQENYLWEQIVTQTKAKDFILQLSKTADVTQSGWSLLKQWQIDIQLPIFKTSEDAHTLFQWLHEFKKYCSARQLIDQTSLPDIIRTKVETRAIIPPKKILAFGFTELTPQIKQLLHACQQQGTKLTQLEPAQKNVYCVRKNFANADDELLAVARWAKSCLQQNNLNVVIGCVFASLDQMRDRVVQVFSDVFVDTNLFNISAGKSLAHYPLIHCALLLLNWSNNKVSIEVFDYLLASPFLGEAEQERIKRAQFGCQLRRMNLSTVTLDNERLQMSAHCPFLALRIKNFFALLNQCEKWQAFSRWANVFHELLSTLGWPGERSLNSEEYQVMEAWLTLLAQFKTLDYVAEQVNFSQALHILNKMAIASPFQPQSPEAPIQVLGLLEAAALPFDYLWMTGMDDLNWPPQPKPHPLIPKLLQREQNMPHATAEREYVYCQRLLQQFQSSAKHIIFSYAEKNEELELQASPLIRHFPISNGDELDLEQYKTPSERIFYSQRIGRIIDDNGPRVNASEKIHGGISVIKHQALCPFRAFAEWRLHAHELESPLLGLRTKDRGQILHKILEKLWTKIQNQQTLLQMEEAELDKMIYLCIDHALEKHLYNEKQTYFYLEKKRLHKIIKSWLEIEKNRQPFSIDALEQKIEMQLNQLHLSIRVDRIDKLENGHKLIIDYKSGKMNDVNHFFSERPEEPQLPLYALIDPGQTIGIAFAQLFPGSYGFKGVSKYTLEIAGVKLIANIKKTDVISWEQQIEQWRFTFTKLSDDFCNGRANVDPKQHPQTCHWCALKPLCRVNDI